MGYNKTTGVIIGSPSIYDVQRALGVSECDLKSLATHSKLNVLSKYKPTDYAYNFVMPNTTSWDNFWRGRAKYDSDGSLYVGCGMIVPYFSIPASKTSLANNNHTLDRDLGVAGGSIDSYWIGDMTNIINSSMISTDYSNGATMPKWTKIPPSAGQLVEFLYYTSRSPVYNKTASLPFSLSVAMPQSKGNETLDPSAQITYNYNDVKVTSGSDSAYWLGVKSLFGCDSGDGGADLGGGIKRKFGVIVCNTNSSRKYVLISNSNTVQMDDDPTHGVTGLDYIKNVGGNVFANMVGNDKPYFHNGDKVNVIPVIIAKSNADNKYYFFTLGLDSISPIYTFQLRENIPTQAIHVRRITFKLSYKFVQSRVFDFYIANNTDVKIVAQSVTRNYTSTNNHLYFVSNVLQITSADSIGNAVDVKTATLGTHSPDANTYRYSSLDTGSHISKNTGETFYAETMLSAFWDINNFRSRIRFNGDGTSAKVGLTIPIYHRQKDNADTSVSKMVTEYFNFEFTINPSRQSDGYLEVTVNAQYDYN